MLVALLLGSPISSSAATKKKARGKEYAGKKYTSKKKKSSTWESFTYNITALNQRAAVATARVEKDRKGRPTVLFAESKTVGTVAKAFPMEHQQVSHIRKGKRVPKKTIQKRDDPFGKISLKVSFPKNTKKPVVVDSHRKGKERTRRRVLPAGVHDPLSALLEVSTHETHIGDSWEIPMFSGKKLYGVRVRTVAKKDVWTPALGIHPSYHLEILVYREPKWTQKGKKGFKIVSAAPDGWSRKINLWISAEKPGTILKATYNIQPLGEAQVLLESVNIEKKVAKTSRRKKS